MSRQVIDTSSLCFFVNFTFSILFYIFLQSIVYVSVYSDTLYMSPCTLIPCICLRVLWYLVYVSVYSDTLYMSPCTLKPCICLRVLWYLLKDDIILAIHEYIVMSIILTCSNKLLKIKFSITGSISCSANNYTVVCKFVLISLWNCRHWQLFICLLISLTYVLLSVGCNWCSHFHSYLSVIPFQKHSFFLLFLDWV